MATADLSAIVQSCSRCCQPDSDASRSYSLTSTRFNPLNQRGDLRPVTRDLPHRAHSPLV